MPRPIGFRKNLEREEEKEEKKEEIIRPIGFLRNKELSLSEQIDYLIDMKYGVEQTICLVAEKLSDAYYRMLSIDDEYRALCAEIKKIKKMKKFKELIHQAKQWAREEEEATLELAKVYKSIGFCEYITGKKQDGVKNLSLGIMTLLCLENTNEALEEIKTVASLASHEKTENAERILKSLFKEMVDSGHPQAMIEAAAALVKFYKKNEMYKEAADVYGSVLTVCQTNLHNKEIAEMYTQIVLPEFIKLKKKAGENVMSSLFIAFDDMYHIAARNIELVYFERLREIAKEIANAINGQTPEEMLEIVEKFRKYIGLFEKRKLVYDIEEQEFFIDGIKNFLKENEKLIKKLEGLSKNK
ncbi:MAG: hypothetical protein ACPL06_01185 [Candidatus Anstonellales archaeon]